MTVVIVIAGIYLLLLLYTKGPLGTLVNAWVARGEPSRMQDPLYAMLRRGVERVGKELEALPYERLLDAENLSRSEVIEGVEVAFSVETIGVSKTGAVRICIDAHASVKGWRGKWQVQPSYEFWKRKDGSVHY